MRVWSGASPPRGPSRAPLSPAEGPRVILCVGLPYAMEEFIEAVRQFPCLWNTELKEYRDPRKKEEAWQQIVAKSNEIPDSKCAKAEWKKLRDSHRDSLKRAKIKTGQAAKVINNWKYAELMQFLLPHMRNRKRTGHLTMLETNLSTVKTSDLQMQDSENSNQITISSDLQVKDSEHSNDTLQVTQNQNIPQNYMCNKNSRKRKSDEIDKNVNEKVREINDNYNHSFEKQRRIFESQKVVTEKHPLDSLFESMCTTTKQFPTWLQNSVKRKIFKIVSEAEDIFENLKNTAPQSSLSTSTCDIESITISPDNLCNSPQRSSK